MLSLTMNSGEYLLIGQDVRIMFDWGTHKNNMRVSVDAPREVPVVRSKVLKKAVDELAISGNPDFVAVKYELEDRELKHLKAIAEGKQKRAAKRLVKVADAPDGVPVG